MKRTIILLACILLLSKGWAQNGNNSKWTIDTQPILPPVFDNENPAGIPTSSSNLTEDHSLRVSKYRNSSPRHSANTHQRTKVDMHESSTNKTTDFADCSDNNTARNQKRSQGNINDNRVGYSKELDIEKIKFGDSFMKWQSYLKPLGSSSYGVCQSYENIKPISKLYWGHKVGKVIVSSRENVIVRKIILLLPNSSDIDIPNTMLQKMEASLGRKFQHVNNEYGSTYGLNVDGTLMTVSRMNNKVTEDRDRIVITVATRGACK